MEYYRGDRVRILGKPEWGSGLVQERSKKGRVKVVFRNVGAKTLSLAHAKIMKVVVRDAKWCQERTRAVQERNRILSGGGVDRALSVEEMEVFQSGHWFRSSETALGFGGDRPFDAT